MKRKLKVSKAIIYAFGALLIALYVVLFTGRVTDPATEQTRWTWFTPNGLQSFRLGMDVSWGVRLTYKVDFSKYAQQYATIEELSAMKKNALNIIKNQIDKRVSVLGVSDYQAYTKSIDENDYIIVELGGVHSLEQAKDIIGKTVELEFKLAFDETRDDSSAAREQRKSLVSAVLQDVQANPDSFAQLGQGKQSDDVYYQEFLGQSIETLPVFFSNNAALLSSMESGQVSDAISGVFHTSYGYDQEGALTSTSLEGHTIVKFIGKEEKKIEKVSLAKVQSVANINNLSLTTTEVLWTQEIAPQTFRYDQTKSQIVHNNGQVLTGVLWYNIDIYAQPKESLIGKSDEEIAAINEAAAVLTNEVVAAVQAGQEVTVEGVQQLSDSWLGDADIKGVIPSFVVSGDSVQTFDTLQQIFVVKVKQTKQPQDELYTITTINEVTNNNVDKISEELQTELLISAETIFIKDTPSWVAAVDPETKEVLNGAYFKQARLDTTQGTPTVAIDFDDKGKLIFCRITKAHIQEQMAIFVGGVLQTAPTIQDEICGGTAIINGQESVADARSVIDGLNEWALPAPLILANEEKVSPSLGERALTASLIAGAIGLFVIFLMLWAMYGHRKATVGILVLLMFLVYLMAFLKVIDYAVSLSGIAAILLSLGMGIDANILIFERVREELKNGKRMKAAIDTWYARSWNPIFDGNFSTFFIALFLVGWGLWVFKWFGTVMILTILLILLINVPVTKHLLHLFFQRKKDYMNDK